MRSEFGGVFGQGGAVRVGLYARVSTHDQQTLPLQLAAMTEYIARRGWAAVVQIEDVGKSCSGLGGGRSTWCWSGDWTAGAGR
jgi:hypothetical protein